MLVFQGEGRAASHRVQRHLLWPLLFLSILFKLSMDYHVFILTRIRELFDVVQADLEARQGTVEPAGAAMAIVMVGILDVRRVVERDEVMASSRAAVLIDATITRARRRPRSCSATGNWRLPRRLGWLPQVSVEPEVSAR